MYIPATLCSMCPLFVSVGLQPKLQSMTSHPTVSSHGRHSGASSDGRDTFKYMGLKLWI